MSVVAKCGEVEVASVYGSQMCRILGCHMRDPEFLM